MNLRRPLPLFLLSLLLAGAWSCDRTSAGPPVTAQGSGSDGGSTESQRTQEMEHQAADIDRQAQEMQNMQGSEQDKIDAYNKLQQEQQDLNQTAEGGQ
ncbi:MAG TPA: hypothetical protein VHC97_04130 [Thermoanaerobaculia bacterium]|jgi:hypothetical protein|nr:hypothetical protein [Thermoanaerobaculia bacterium]